MFIAYLITKTEETAISCKTFQSAWSTLNKLADNAKGGLVSGFVLEEAECNLSNLAACKPVASMRTIR